MPRPKAVRNDLSAGWHELHRRWGESFDQKISYSKALILDALQTHKHPVVCWSGGKDSTVVLHLVRSLQPSVLVVFVMTGVDFPETIQFVEDTARRWRLDLHVARPNPKLTFWDIGKRYGWPILGKAVASNVERARRTGNIRPQLSALEKQLVESRLHISCKCAEVLLERASRQVEETLHADAKFIGLRADESRARVRLWVDHGDHYYVKRYFGRNRGIWKVNPIAVWRDEDIWKYHSAHRLPKCGLYAKGYPRNGCWPCAMAVRNGQLKRLRQFHPRLFRKLLLRTPMGSELVRASLLAKGQKPKQRYTAEHIKKLLSADPTFLDFA